MPAGSVFKKLNEKVTFLIVSLKLHGRFHGIFQNLQNSLGGVFKTLSNIYDEALMGNSLPLTIVR